MPSGGKRIGAGKKPGKFGTKSLTSISLSDDVRAFLAEQQPSTSSHIESVIRKTKAFKDWLKAKK